MVRVPSLFSTTHSCHSCSQGTSSYSLEALQALKKNAIHQSIPTDEDAKVVTKEFSAPIAGEGGPVRDYSMDFAVDELPEELMHQANMRTGDAWIPSLASVQLINRC